MSAFDLSAQVEGCSAERGQETAGDAGLPPLLSPVSCLGFPLTRQFLYPTNRTIAGRIEAVAGFN